MVERFTRITVPIKSFSSRYVWEQSNRNTYSSQLWFIYFRLTLLSGFQEIIGNHHEQVYGDVQITHLEMTSLHSLLGRRSVRKDRCSSDVKDGTTATTASGRCIGRDGWKPLGVLLASLLWRPPERFLLGKEGISSSYCSRLKAIAIGLEAITIRLEAIAGRLEAIAGRLEAIAGRLEAIAGRLEVQPEDTPGVISSQGRKHRQGVP